MSKTTRTEKKPIEQYSHKGKERCNNPPVGLVTPETDGGKKAYAYDSQLQWAGKTEHTSFEIPTISLHVHERIDPRTIIDAVRKRYVSAFICVHLRLISLTESSRIINAEVL